MMRIDSLMSVTMLYASLLSVPAFAQEILWDNGEWDLDSATASERNTSIPDTWTVDDAIFDRPVVIAEYHWSSALDIGFDPVAVDFIVLTDSFDLITELRDLPFRSEFLREWRGRHVFAMEIDGLEIELDSGRYYLGARPVGRGEHRAFTATNYTILGQTEAYFRSAFFGYPDWTPVSWILGVERDIAFAVFGTAGGGGLNGIFDCPIGGGVATLSLNGGTPGGPVGVAASFFNPGFAIPIGPCAGTIIATAPPYFGGTPILSKFDANGDLALSANVPPGLCADIFVSAIDLVTCDVVDLAP